MGNCFCYLPGVIVVATYFEKRRSVAMGIATSGVGLGAFAFAPLINYLDETYGWRGALLLCGGVSLNMCVSSLLFRPLPVTNQRTSTGTDAREVDLQVDQVSIKEIELADDGETNQMNCQHSLSEVQHDSNTQTRHIITPFNKVNNCHPKSLTMSVVTTRGQSPNGMAVDNLESLLDKHKVQLKGAECRISASLSELDSKQTSSYHLHSSQYLSSQRMKIPYKESLFKSLQNVDINAIGSVKGFHHILDKGELEDENLLSLKDTNNYEKYEEYSKDSKKTFVSKILSNSTVKSNLQILRHKAFLTLAFSNFLTNLSFITPIVFLVDRAIHQGIDKHTAAVLISANGVGNIFGRIFFGWFFDHCCSNRLMAYSMCLNACGVVTMLSSLCGNIVYLHAAYAAAFGCLIGIYTLLAPLVTVDLMGVTRVAKSFGLLLSFMGPALVIGPPLAGWLFDWTKSYDVPYIINGLFLLASGLMLLPLLCVRKSKHSKKSDEDT